MSVGVSLLLFAVGAILRYAVTWNSQDINVETVGLILMLVGIVGLILSLLWMFVWADRRRDAAVVAPREPREPPRY